MGSSSEGFLWWSSCQARSSNLQAIVAQLTRHSRGGVDVDFEVVGCDPIQMDQDVWSKMEQHWPNLEFDILQSDLSLFRSSSSCAGGVLGNRLAVAFEMGVRNSIVILVLSPLWRSTSTAEDRLWRGVLRFSLCFMESAAIRTPFSMTIAKSPTSDILIFSKEMFDRLMAVNPWVQTWWRAAESLGRLSQVLGRSCGCFWQPLSQQRFFENNWLAFLCINSLFAKSFVDLIVDRIVRPKPQAIFGGYRKIQYIMSRLQQSEVVHLVEEAGWENGQTIYMWRHSLDWLGKFKLSTLDRLIHAW